MGRHVVHDELDRFFHFTHLFDQSVLVKNIDILGYWWGGYMKFRPEALRDSLSELFGWYAAGRLAPHVSHEIPFARAAEAYELLRSRASTGKVVVTMDADGQNDPADIPAVLAELERGDFDLVGGWRRNRKEPVLTRRLPARFRGGRP